MIKKILSISTIILLLAAMLQISVATHYCGGMIASSKVSLSGELATCGMESRDSQLPVSGLSLSSHCCDNVVTHFVISGNYFPSFTNVPEDFQQHLQTFEIPDFLLSNISASLKIPRSESPPSYINSSQVDLSYICIFRI
jgi:hypothetical protein